jgi:hypothetical protein
VLLTNLTARRYVLDRGAGPAVAACTVRCLEGVRID